MIKFDYNEWCQTQFEKLRSGVNRLAMSGIYDGVVYCLPSNGATPGELVLATEPPAEMLEVVRFGLHGDRIASIPTTALHSAIWNACRRLPICPTA